MKLSEYLAVERGRVAALACATGVSGAFVSQIATGARKVPGWLAAAVERATQGQVTCEQLRPDVRWQRVPDPTWPHPQGRPCIDVAAPAPVAREAA